MTRVKIADLLADAQIDPERHLDPERVEHYRRSIDAMDPVVFDTDRGLLLADGYHRVAAALKEGRETVDADVREGTRRDALEYAVRVGAAQRGMSPDDVRKRILGRDQRSPEPD